MCDSFSQEVSRVKPDAEVVSFFALAWNSLQTTSETEKKSTSKTSDVVYYRPHNSVKVPGKCCHNSLSFLRNVFRCFLRSQVSFLVYLYVCFFGCLSTCFFKCLSSCFFGWVSNLFICVYWLFVYLFLLFLWCLFSCFFGCLSSFFLIACLFASLVVCQHIALVACLFVCFLFVAFDNLFSFSVDRFYSVQLRRSVGRPSLSKADPPYRPQHTKSNAVEKLPYK